MMQYNGRFGLAEVKNKIVFVVIDLSIRLLDAIAIWFVFVASRATAQNSVLLF